MASVSSRLFGGSAVALAALLAARASSADLGPPPAPPAPPAPAAEPAPADPSAWEKAPATRRSGFAMGVALGFGVGSVVGFPADVKKVGYAPYYTVTGVRPAPIAEAWVGGALADWINVGIGLTGTVFLATGDNTAKSLAGVFHIEAFPLFYVSDALRDLGVMFDAGAGRALITSPADKNLVDSSAASLVGGGVFYEPLKLWRIRGGPFLMGNYMWSGTARRPAIFAGWRMSLYSGAR